ncbi:MAG: AraC family transcriptional regulator [Byssovorax sp.]
MDVLSDMLSTIRLRSMVFTQTELTAPWGIRAEPLSSFAFHIMARGSGWLEIDDDHGPIQICAGDVAVIAPGRIHTLRDAPGTRARPLREWMATGAFAPMRAGGDEQPGLDATTQVVCGCFHFEDPGSEVLLAALPAVIHTGATTSDVGPWLAQTIKLITYESVTRLPGTETVVNRLCDALFVYVLRSYLAESAKDESSWLRALVEPQIGASLRLIHESPSEAWTVATLGTRVGMSRSAFAARFAELVGETPMRYLTRWRLQKAAGMLRAGEAGIAEVAAHVGYDSEASFNKAFKRSIGVAPGSYRRTSRAPEAAWSAAPRS